MADESVDLAVIGAGPAGLSAAVTAAELGASVALFDEQPAPGGQVWRGLERQGRGGDRAGHDLIARARSTAGIRLRLATTVFHAAFEGADGPTLSWMDAGGLGRTTARGLVLATGAMERPLAFPGWTLPGVLGVGALQAALKTGGLVPESGGGGLVIVGRGALVLLYLAQLAAAGGRTAAVLELAGPGRNLGRLASRLPGALLGDPATLGRGSWLLAARARRGVPLHRGVTNLQAEGGGRVEAVRFTDAGGERVLPCRLLAVHDGVIPNTQASRLLRLDHEWRDDAACFAPVTDDWGRASRVGKALGGAGVWVAGDGAGIEGAKGAAIAGRLAGLDAARCLGRLPESAFRAHASAPLRARAGIQALRRFLDTLDPPLDPAAGLADGTVVCRCEEVTAGTIRAAIAGGAVGPNRVKTATRCGMGACQGRVCGPILTRLLAHETGRPAAEIGALRVRPPLKPVPLGALAALDRADAPVEAEEE